MNTTVKYSGFYFGIVFTVGFLLGIFRTLYLVPKVGESSSELIEIPFMTLICYLSARQVIYRAHENLSQSTALLIGLLSLLYLLAVEFSLVLWLRGVSISEYLHSKYSIAGIAYLVSLLLYAAFPYLVLRYKKNP